MATGKKTVAQEAPSGGPKEKGTGAGGMAKNQAKKKAKPVIEGEPTLTHVLDRLAVVERKLDKVLRQLKSE